MVLFLLPEYNLEQEIINSHRTLDKFRIFKGNFKRTLASVQLDILVQYKADVFGEIFVEHAIFPNNLFNVNMSSYLEMLLRISCQLS